MPGAYLFANLITMQATITPSSEDDSYLVGNIHDLQAARVFRCESGTSLSILFDFGGMVRADTIAIVNHNLTASATLSLKAGASSPPSTVVATPVYRAHDIYISFASTLERYWLLEITDTNSEDLEIGQLILGVRVVLPRARRIGSYSPARERSNISGETYAGVFWNYHLFERHKFNPIFRVGSAVELAVLTGLDAAVYGDLWPFVYIPDITKADCYSVRKERDYTPQEIAKIGGGELAHDYQMSLLEESRGLNIQA